MVIWRRGLRMAHAKPRMVCAYKTFTSRHTRKKNKSRYSINSFQSAIDHPDLGLIIVTEFSFTAELFIFFLLPSTYFYFVKECARKSDISVDLPIGRASQASNCKRKWCCRDSLRDLKILSPIFQSDRIPPNFKNPTFRRYTVGFSQSRE